MAAPASRVVVFMQENKTVDFACRSLAAWGADVAQLATALTAAPDYDQPHDRNAWVHYRIEINDGPRGSAGPAIRLHEGVDQARLGHLRLARDVQSTRHVEQVRSRRPGIDALRRLGRILTGIGTALGAWSSLGPRSTFGFQ